MPNARSCAPCAPPSCSAVSQAPPRGLARLPLLPSAVPSRSTLPSPPASGRRFPSSSASLPFSAPVSTPTGFGTSTGSTGLTCLLWRSVLSIPTRTSGPRTTSGVTVTRLSSGTTRSTTTTRTRLPKKKTIDPTEFLYM